MAVCIICNSKDFSLITTQLRQGEGRILKCKGCGLIIQDLCWDRKLIKKYYEKEYQISNSLVCGKMQKPLEHYKDRKETIRPIFDQIRPMLKPKSKVLEIGCGTGELLSLIKPYVAKCVATELNTAFVKFIKSYLKIEAYAEDLSELQLNGKFDLVISIATLDHLKDPYRELLSMKERISPLGKIYIEVPNYSQALNHFLPLENRFKFNRFFWNQAHFYYFNRDTITALFKKSGLRVKVSCRHDYTLKNFLQWYFLGEPQPSLVAGMLKKDFFAGKSDFEKKMNGILAYAENEFKKISSRTFTGESLCCVGYI